MASKEEDDELEKKLKMNEKSKMGEIKLTCIKNLVLLIQYFKQFGKTKNCAVKING